jgi:hypothetical protein
MSEVASPDCGDHSCLYAMPHQKTGMRTNGGCRCDKAEGMQVHSKEARPGWYYTRKAMTLGRLGMAARDQKIRELEERIIYLEEEISLLDECDCV